MCGNYREGNILGPGQSSVPCIQYPYLGGSLSDEVLLYSSTCNWVGSSMS